MSLSAWTLPELPIPSDSWSVFTVVLVALIVFIWRIARLVSQVTEDSDPAETDRQMLTAISDLRRKGDLSPEEFRSIKSQLVERLRSHADPAGGEPFAADESSDSAGRRATASVSAVVADQDTIVDSVTQTDLHPPSEKSSPHPAGDDEAKNADEDD